MKEDPHQSARTVTVYAPPHRGPGSGKDAWVRFGLEIADANQYLHQLLDEQSVIIRELRAEVELLREQIAKRKPKGGRPRLKDRTVASIEADLAAGLSMRAAAVRNGVSAMAVSRIARRDAQRKAAAF